MLLFCSLFSRTDVFGTVPFQLIFRIFHQIQTLKASNRFLSAQLKTLRVVAVVVIAVVVVVVVFIQSCGHKTE